MALTANAFVDLDEAREELKETSQKYDSVIERRINGLSTTIETETGLIFNQQDLTGYRVNGGADYQGSTGVTYRITGRGRMYLLIPIVPVQSVTKVDIHFDFDDSVYRTITDPAIFILKGKDRYGHSLTGRLQLFSEVFIPGKENVLLDMRVGFASTHPTLAEAKRLMMKQLSFEYSQWKNNQAGVLSKTLPDGSISFVPPQNLLKEVKDGLAALNPHVFV